jgi:hypothetical protein
VATSHTSTWPMLSPEARRRWLPAFRSLEWLLSGDLARNGCMNDHQAVRGSWWCAAVCMEAAEPGPRLYLPFHSCDSCSSMATLQHSRELQLLRLPKHGCRHVHVHVRLHALAAG